MKTELKRSYHNLVVYMITAVMGIVIYGAGYFLDASDLTGYSLVLGGLSAVCIIYELYRLNGGTKLYFDENNFYVGDTTYAYSEIESIITQRTRRAIVIRIYVQGECIFTFTHRYKNITEFYKILHNHNVSFNPYGTYY